tara:strand:- start:39803 stop:40816 length:1014 start_codon:yes stop_codon:yes gene_type:complete
VGWADEKDWLDRDSPYLILSYSKRKALREPPPVKFYDNKEFKGDPVMVMDKKGLSIRGKLECDWRGSISEGMLKVHEEAVAGNYFTVCPRKGPIVSGDDSPVIIEVKDNQSKNFYETKKYEDRVLYVSKKEAELFEYRESENSVQRAEIAANKASYEALKKSDKSLVEFLEKWNKCVEQKDEKCLPKGDESELSVRKPADLWRDYACIKGEDLSKDPFCVEWLKYRCGFEGELKRKSKCDRVESSDERPKASEKFDKKAKDLVWNFLSRCFLKENLEKNYVVVNRSSMDIMLEIKARGDFPDGSCVIQKNLEKQSNWRLIQMVDESDFRLDGTFVIY